MSNTLISLVVFVSFLLGGCQSSSTVKPEATSIAAPAAETTKPALSEEAQQALAKSEADVKEAKSRAALWTTAADALKKAQEAATKGDSATTMKFSRIASEQTRLSLAQKNYPLTK